MKFQIRHELRGRLRIHLMQKRMSFHQADVLQYYLDSQENVQSVKIYERTADVTIGYKGSREEMLRCVRRFQYKKAEPDVPETYLQNTGRELSSEYFDRLVMQAVVHFGKRLFIPAPVRACIACVKAVPYIWKGLKTLAAGKIEVPVLDAAAIGVSILRADYNTAASVMFLLGIGETLEEWTHKRSVGDLARSMSLGVSKVWLVTGQKEEELSGTSGKGAIESAAQLSAPGENAQLEPCGQEVLVPVTSIRPGDVILVRMGTVIPFDGTVVGGEAMVNQASLTGEGIAVRKALHGSVFAGTVIEEGELQLRVDQTVGSSRYEKIVTMIEETEKLKSALESKAEHLADQLVPYTLAGSALTWLISRNVTKAVSVLMVDFSCALKLAMPISVLSAIREASTHSITVKGGRFLEAVAEADTIVFDKTGTLTKAQPTVVDVVSFNGDEPDELLRTAACLEEHFPHSMAKAVVKAAAEKNLAHEEKHSTVSYIVAHGISSMLDGKKMVIGSYHFVFEDEGCVIPEGKQELFDSLPAEYSHLYLAVENVLAAVICIEDPIRPEAKQALEALRMAGISKIVMMTGDSERTAAAVAARVGVDEYYSEVLPEDKAKFVEQERAKGRKVIMVGDGINDSPALSAADVGIAISEGAEIAREIADIMVGADDLEALVTLKLLSDALMRRIRQNYRVIVGFNTSLIALGVAGVLSPTVSALLHNTSTLLIGMRSMKNLITKEPFDYAEWRAENLEEGLSVRELSQRAMAYSKEC
ncbi:MAG: heavy metal translocating P-type ATPase [Lachnospiraceae bacterium]|nr:heavy metal translocating P-type ATPase [Lachnospiraceae bacterium]